MGDEQGVWVSSSTGRRLASWEAARTTSRARSTLPASLRSLASRPRQAGKQARTASIGTTARAAARLTLVLSAGVRDFIRRLLDGQRRAGESSGIATSELAEPAGLFLVKNIAR